MEGENDVPAYPDLGELGSEEIAAMSSEERDRYLTGVMQNENLSEDVQRDSAGSMDSGDEPDYLMANTDDMVRQVAEVVLIQSTLTVNKVAYHDSIRLKHFLDAKGVRYVMIDVNKEFSKARNLVDEQLISCWKSLGLLYMEETVDGLPITPQLLIDGISIGSLREAEDYEEDEDFNYCLERLQCPACFHPRESTMATCDSCESHYQELINPKLIQSGKVLVMHKGINLDTTR